MSCPKNFFLIKEVPMDGQQPNQQQGGQPDQRTWYASLWEITKKIYGKKVFCAVSLLVNISINLYIISLVFVNTLVKAIQLIGLLITFISLLTYLIRINDVCTVTLNDATCFT